MQIIQMTPENVARYLCAAGIGTKEAIKNATSPHIVYANGLLIFSPAVE